MGVLGDVIMRNLSALDPEFGVGRNKKDNTYHLRLSASGMDVSLRLTGREWLHLKRFLKKTRTDRALPKDALGYQGFEVDKNRILCVNLQAEIRFINAFAAHLKKRSVQEQKDWTKTSIAAAKRRAGRVRKTLLDDDIYLFISGGHITLKRSKFVRFREYCLQV